MLYRTPEQIAILHKITVESRIIYSSKCRMATASWKKCFSQAFRYGKDLSTFNLYAQGLENIEMEQKLSRKGQRRLIKFVRNFMNLLCKQESSVKQIQSKRKKNIDF